VAGFPETRYAMLGGAHIAYQVVGSGSVEIVFVPQWFSNVEALWGVPSLVSFVERLARFGRVLVFDKRGTGVSDPLPPSDDPFLENFNDDLVAVLDDAGFARPAIVAGDSAGLMAIVFAASQPTRVSSLVLVSAYANRAGGDEDVARFQSDYTLRLFSQGEGVELLAPTLSRDPSAIAGLLRYLRLAASPGAALAARRQLLDVDVSDILPVLRAPTLVIHRTENAYVALEHGRVLAARIPNARLVELPGDDHLMFSGDQAAILDEIEVFLTGHRRPIDVDRALVTVLFTDIASSTEQATTLGDRDWLALLDRFRATVREQLDQYRGREISTRGDDFLATFDGPARAIRCARAIAETSASLGLTVRSGLHTGEVELMGDDVAGIAVHIGSRIAALAQPDEILVSRTVVDLVSGSGIQFDDRGEHHLKGVAGAWRLFAVHT
jgi:class 3 adenylate cyclase